MSAERYFDAYLATALAHDASANEPSEIWWSFKNEAGGASRTCQVNL
jgi:hypothetical protein